MQSWAFVKLLLNLCLWKWTVLSLVADQANTAFMILTIWGVKCAYSNHIKIKTKKKKHRMYVTLCKYVTFFLHHFFLLDFSLLYQMYLFCVFFEPMLLREMFCITEHTYSISFFALSTIAQQWHWNAKNTSKISPELWHSEDMHMWNEHGYSIDAGGERFDKTGICCQAAPGGSVFVLQWTVFKRARPQVGSRRAAAFQDRQCESAIWLHQTGLDNKPPEYKGSTVLFHYFLFPKATCQSCWRSHTTQYLYLCHSYIILSCALWLRWYPYVTTGLMYKVSFMQWCR